MADSEISTSLSAPTRRTVISAALATSGGSLLPSRTAPEAAAKVSRDPAMAAWEKWKAAHRKTLALCRKQQRLESELVRTVGFPHVVLNAAELPSPVRIGSLQEFDEIAAVLPSIARFRADVGADLRAHRECWDVADQALGYSVTLQLEARSSDAEEQLAADLFAADATTLVGISAKVDALLALGSMGNEDRDFPWPQLRRIRTDVARIARRFQDHP